MNEYIIAAAVLIGFAAFNYALWRLYLWRIDRRNRAHDAEVEAITRDDR